MNTPPKIFELVERFQQNKAEYKSSTYNETQTKNDFIDPFFKALGWDISNEKGSSEAYRDVIYEYNVKIGNTLKAPDYCFRIGKDPQFFVEAKKPSIKIAQDPKPSFQLRRYGWSASLPVSILTDFEEFAVYDCRIQPNEKDKPAVARILYFNCSEYVERWDEIASLFSRDAVLGGSLNQFITSQKIQKGNQTVDTAFLNEIENWRNILAANLIFHNPELSSRNLNYAVQITINRIIFLRICEDRGTETYGKLEDLRKESNVYKRLCQIFLEADNRYNSGLFHFKSERNRTDFDNFTLDLGIGDLPLKSIIKNLYYPSPYEFSVIPIEIIGQVYEQFLGKVITLSSTGVTVEDKPEVRKAGGVYYTPTYIVNYIVQNTVGKLLDGKTAKQAAKLKILDPACGSGSFLIGAYQYLLEWYRDYYLNNPTRNAPIYESMIGWQLTTTEKKKILLDNIFGVDIDNQAVEVTKLSLLLKVLEGESQESVSNQLRLFQERALPDLDNNIKCGNSLINSDFYNQVQMSFLNEDEVYRVNVFDWEQQFSAVMKSGGFDIIIGNPPYIRIQTLKEWASREVDFYKQAYLASGKGNYDIYVIFLEKGLNLLNKKGRLGFILPHKFFNSQYGEPIRKIISSGKNLSEIIHFGDQQVFKGATTYTCLIFLDKYSNEFCKFTRATNINEWRLQQVSKDIHNTQTLIPTSTINTDKWNFLSINTNKIFKKLDATSIRLGDLASIFVGLQTSADKIYILKEIAVPKNNLVKVRDRNNNEWELEQQVLKPFLSKYTVSSFNIPKSNHWLLFPYKLDTGKAVLITQDELASLYPRTWEYLKSHSQTLKERDSRKVDNETWYGYIYRKNLTLFESPKLIVQVISSFGRYAYDASGLYFTGGGNGPYYGIRWKSRNNQHSLHYLQGILSSRLLDFYLYQVSSPFRGGYWSYGKRFIEQLPIRIINFDLKQDKDKHDCMVSLVEQMLLLDQKLGSAKSPIEKNVTQKQMEIVDRQINQLVYELYEVTDEEIEIVQKSYHRLER